MNILIDIGNTRLKWRENKRGINGLIQAFSYTSEDLCFKLGASGIKEIRAGIENVYISNVAGEKIKLIIHQWCVDNLGIEPQFAVSHGSVHGLFNAYINPDQLGVDRYLAMLGAVSVVGTPVVVVDCGTAVTIDSVNIKKEFIGGVILPGLNLMRKSLGSNTSGLTYSDTNNVCTPFALDTQSGIFSGAVMAITSTVENVVKQLSALNLLSETRKSNGYENKMGSLITHDNANRSIVRCIVSGGDGEFIFSCLGIDAEYQDDLVLKGLSVYFQAG